MTSSTGVMMIHLGMLTNMINTHNQLTMSNTALKTVDIQGKPYVTVNERIKYFRQHFKGHSLVSELTEVNEKSALIKAVIRDFRGVIVATGTAYEVPGQGFINKGSHVENCETSAWGRALANFGIGVDAEVASADEVKTANLNQLIDHDQWTNIERLLSNSSVGDEIKQQIENEMTTFTFERANECIEYLKANQLIPGVERFAHGSKEVAAAAKAAAARDKS